jgi:hypothetical protein
MKIRRFRLSLSVSSGSPARFSNEYWPRERTAFLHTFRPIAERYRRRKRIGLYLLLGFMLGGFASMYVIPDVMKLWGLFLLFAAWLGGIAIFAFGLRLRCPQCRNRLDRARGPYCPQCGSDQFQRGANYSYCPACDGRIVDEDADSARSYRIRGCTHCGVMLDEMGV